MVESTLKEQAPSRDDVFEGRVLSSALPLQVSICGDDDAIRDMGTTAGGRSIDLPATGDITIVEPRLDLDEAAWDRLLGEMKERRIPGLRAGGRLSDRHLSRIGELADHLVYLDLEGTNTDIKMRVCGIWPACGGSGSST